MKKKNYINAMRIRKDSKKNYNYTYETIKTIEFIKKQNELYTSRFLPHVHGRNLIIIDESKTYDSLNNNDKEYIGGIHYKSNKLRELNNNTIWKRDNNLQYISASCHSIHEIKIANKLNIDFILLSPITTNQKCKKKFRMEGIQ